MPYLVSMSQKYGPISMKLSKRVISHWNLDRISLSAGFLFRFNLFGLTGSLVSHVFPLVSFIKGVRPLPHPSPSSPPLPLPPPLFSLPFPLQFITHCILLHFTYTTFLKYPIFTLLCCSIEKIHLKEGKNFFKLTFSY